MEASVSDQGTPQQPFCVGASCCACPRLARLTSSAAIRVPLRGDWTLRGRRLLLVRDAAQPLMSVLLATESGSRLTVQRTGAAQCAEIAR